MMVAMAHGVVFAALAAAALSDLAWRRIPDLCSIAIVAAFALQLAAAPAALGGVLWHLTAGLALFAVGAVLFARGLFGGGDVKLLAALSLFAGWAAVPDILLATALFGGVLALACLVAQRRRWRWTGFLTSEEGIPYGVAIALAGLVV
jgi:prepilin peptidase CpaA